MSFMRRLFSSAYRQARRAEAKGLYREAAAIYAENDLPEEAANALLVHAARASELEEQLAALRDALRWLPEGHDRRIEVEGRIGTSILEEAQRRGVHTAEEKRRLEEAAQRLETAELHSKAATAYEMLDRTDDVARCLQLAGDVERLEALLEETSGEARKERALRRFLSDYEMAMAVGHRLEARKALEQALEVSPEERTVADLLRRLEARFIPGRRLTLRFDGREVSFVGRTSLVLGRDADVVVRGASVSRRHTEILRVGSKIVVRDLESRNGTLVRGVPIAGELEVDGVVDVGLGDDVTVRVTPIDGGLRLRVLEGLDRDRVALAGEGALRIDGLSATIAFEKGHPTLTPDEGSRTRLDRQNVAARIVLLLGDAIEVDGVAVEVL